MPRYVGSGSRQSKLAFIQRAGKTWFETVRPKVDRAEGAFEDAAASAPSDATRLEVHGEAAEVDVEFSERFLSLGREGEPAEWRADPDLDQTFVGSLLGALATFRTRARKHLDQCATLARGGDAPRCKSARARLDALDAIATMPASTPAPSRTSTTPARKATACGCPAGDPLCTCAPTPRVMAPSKSACTCAAADPLCSCVQ